MMNPVLTDVQSKWKFAYVRNILNNAVYAINNAPYSFISFLMGIAQHKIYQNSCVCRAQNCSNPTNNKYIYLESSKFYASQYFRLHFRVSDTSCPDEVWWIQKKTANEIVTDAVKQPEEISAPVTKLTCSSTSQCIQNRSSLILLCSFAAQYVHLNFALILFMLQNY